jgi:hypothetical protein
MDVAGVARHTLASGSARVWQCTFAEPAPPPERSSTTYAEGVADLANVRVRMRERCPPVWAYFAERIAERFPWLDDDEEDDDGDVEAIKVCAGTSAWWGTDDHWIAMGGGVGNPFARRRGPEDPLWILEALTIAGEAAPRSEQPELVRGEPCARVPFEIDLRTGGTQLDEARMRALSDRLRGDVWIDGENRVRRATWKRPYRGRPRSPFKLPPVTLWRTVELWDFGTPVRIELPTTSPPEPGPSLREMFDGLGALWRRKRAYERRQSA